jgi:hypothetical protein
VWFLPLLRSGALLLGLAMGTVVFLKRRVENPFTKVLKQLPDGLPAPLPLLPEQGIAPLRLLSLRINRLLERLNKWQKKPLFTPLGQQPLLPWLYDWQSPFSAGLFLHPGWTVEDPAAEALHALRKQIKRARYSLEYLERWCGPPLLAWIENLRQAQDHLGELHDLQILNSSFVDSEHLRKTSKLPALQAELEAQQQLHWLRWRELAQQLHQDSQRKAIQRHLLELGQGALPSG